MLLFCGGLYAKAIPLFFLDNVMQIVPECFPSRSISRFAVYPPQYIQQSLHFFGYNLSVVGEIDNHHYETWRLEMKNQF